MFEYIIDKNLIFKGVKKKFQKQPTKIVLHHSGASADQTVEQIHDYHINHNGWIGIGYNFLVDKNGNIFKGRGIEYVGAHCKGFNEIAMGICAIGNMDTKKMPEAQKAGIIKLIKDIEVYYPSIVEINGHRELAATDCPGKNYPLEEIKNTESEAQKETAQAANNSFRVKIIADVLNIRSGPGTNYPKIKEQIKDHGTYTIVETSAGDGIEKGWGKLKSGLGWIALKYTENV